MSSPAPQLTAARASGLLEPGPIRILPTELLLRVFQWVHLAYCEFIADRRHPYLLDEIRVCKFWKDVIEGFPGLWQVIVPSSGNDFLRRRALKSSQGQPLMFVASSDGLLTRDSISVLQTILEPTVLQRTRCVKFDHDLQAAQVNSGDPPPLLAVYPLVIRLLTGPEAAPELREVLIRVNVDFVDAPGRPMPKLARLHLTGVNHPPDLGMWARTLQQLVLVRVSGIDGSSFMDALDVMVHLTTLDIILTPLGMRSNYSRQRRSLIFPALKRITFYIEISDMTALMHCFVVPNLESIMLLAYEGIWGTPDAFALPQVNSSPHIIDVIEAARTLSRRRPCDHIELGYVLRLRCDVTPDGLDGQHIENVVRIGVGNGLVHSVVERIALVLIADVEAMRLATSMLLNIPPDVELDMTQWRDALRGPGQVRSLDIVGTAGTACSIFIVLCGDDDNAVALPSLERIVLSPTGFNVAVANAAARLLRQRSTSSPLLRRTLKEFIIREGEASFVASHLEEHTILTDTSLPFVVEFRSHADDLAGPVESEL